MALQQENTEPPAQSLSFLDELFASEPIQITERLVAPSRRYGKRWTKQQKIVMAAVAGGVAFVVLLGIILKMGTSETVNGPGAPPAAVAPFSADEARKHQERWAAYLKVRVETTNSIGMKLTLIPPGEFVMGSPDSDGMADDLEKPQHRVEITKPFYLSVCEVTQAEYEKVVGSNPSFFKGDVRWPVESVSWFDAVVFCNRLSERERMQPYYKITGQTASIVGGNGYRLPTGPAGHQKTALD